MTRSIAFLDVDGTILEHGSLIAPSTIEAIRTARAAGHLVYLCTGRSDGDIHEDVLSIGFDGAITSSGAYATRGDKVLFSHTMPRADVDRMITFFEENDIHYLLQSHNRVFASPGTLPMMQAYLAERARLRAARLGIPVTEDAGGPMEATLREAAARYAPAADADRDNLTKATFVSSHTGVVELARVTLGERFHVIPGSMPLPSGSNGEVSPIGINKGAAIVEVLNILGIDAKDAVGIGDSWNDAEMFQVVGRSVAMGNAAPDVQRLASRVTTPVLDDGIANAFRDLGLI